MANYKLQLPGAEIDARLAAVPNKQDALVSGENIKTIGGQSVLGSGNISVDDQQAVKFTVQTLGDSQKATARNNIGAVSADELANIQSEQYVTVTTLPSAAAGTMGKIYLVGPTNGEYARYITSYDGSSYSWVPLGSTSIDLSGLASQASLDEVAVKVQNITFINSDTEEEIVEFQTDGGNFIAKITSAGIEATDVKARIDGNAVSLSGIYKDPSNTLVSSLSFGDANGNDLVQIDEGHIKTKYFDSRDAATGVLSDTSDNDRESLALGDNNGKNIVEFAGGHVKTKFFDSREAAIGVYIDSHNTDGASLSFGDANDKNIVQFSEGHIQTKYFDSAKVVSDIADLQSRSVGVDDKAQRLMGFKEDYYSYKNGKVPSGYSYAWFERLRILHFSDTHVNLTNLAEMVGLKDYVHLVVDTGDNSNSGAATPASTTLADFQAYTTTIGNVSIPLLITQGNHDSYGDITKAQYFNAMSAFMASKNPSFVFGDSTNYRSYGYLDITPNATVGTVRVVLLDAFDYDDGLFMNPYGQQGDTPNPRIPDFGNQFSPMNCVFSQAQINWFINTLTDAANNGYKVITAMHYSFGDARNYSTTGSARTDCFYHQDPFMIPDIIDAMQHKAAFSATYLDDENINNITINADFTTLTNPLNYICHLFGHIHSENEYRCQKADGSKLYDMLMLGAPNMGSVGKALNKVLMQPNTLNSIKLTVLEIDTVEEAIYRVNYGAYKACDMSVTERTKKIPYRF